MGKRRSDARKAQHQPDDSVGYRHEIIPPGQPDCQYLERWVLGVGLPGRQAWFSLKLHHFFRSDEDHLHDHPTAFLTLVLKGSYEDWVECPICKGTLIVDDPVLVADPTVPRHSAWMPCTYCMDPVTGPTGQVLGTRMTPGKIRYRPALHRHRVVTTGCWTLVLWGRKVRDWGFWVDGLWMRQRAYFRKFGGHSACE